MHQQSGIHIARSTSKTLSQSSTELPDTYNNENHSRTPECVTKMVKNLNWEKLTARRKTNKLLMLYRIQHGLVDIPKQKYLHISDSRTRGQVKVFQERLQDVNYKNSFLPRTARDGNQLPARVVSATSLEEFRSLLQV